MGSPTSGKPYRIEENPDCGRQLVATRKILAGELIINEPALLTGPGFSGFTPGNNSVYNTKNKNESSTGAAGPHVEESCVCLVCCVNFNSSSGTQCSKCRLFLCSESCRTHVQHSQNECLIFPQIRSVWDCNPSRSETSFYNLILIIRGLFYKYRDFSKWDQLLILQDKSEALDKVGAFLELQDVFSSLSWDLFSSSCHPQTSSSEINGNFNYNNNNDQHHDENIVKAAQRCLGVMRINAFSFFSESYSREGLFFLSSFMSHGCVINTDRQMETSGRSTGTTGDISGSRMVIRASVDIEKDEPITTTYLSLLYNTEERNRLMIGSWLFTCHCKRCNDPRECETFSDGIICQNALQPQHPKPNIDFKLSSLICTNAINNCLCKTNIETSMNLILKSRPKSLHDIGKLEDWLDQNDTGEYLHPFHSVFAHIKLFLCQSLGRQSGGLDALSIIQLKRKTLYCLQILDIYNIIFSGIQMCRGVILFELWCALRKLSELHVPLHITYPLLIDETKPSLISVSLHETDITKFKGEALNILKYALPKSPEEAMALILQEDGI